MSDLHKMAAAMALASLGFGGGGYGSGSRITRLGSLFDAAIGRRITYKELIA